MIHVRRLCLMLLVMLMLPLMAHSADVSLSWTNPTLNADDTPLIDLSHINLYRCPGAGCVPVFTRSVGQVSQTTDPGLAPDTIYRYVVVAVDTSSNASAPSNLAEVVTPSAPPPPPPPPSGLIAAYGFNEGAGTTLNDSAGAHHGTIAGATWTTGKYGSALSFDGQNDWVTIPAHAHLDLTTGLTLMAWVYPNVNLTNWRTILQKESSGSASYYLHASSDTNRPATGVWIGGERILKGGNALPRRQWTHVAATYDGQRQRLYVNGTQVAQRDQTGAIQPSTGVLRLGGNGTWGEWINGRIDELRIYNVALTGSAINQARTTPLP